MQMSETNARRDPLRSFAMLFPRARLIARVRLVACALSSALLIALALAGQAGAAVIGLLGLGAGLAVSRGLARAPDRQFALALYWMAFLLRLVTAIGTFYVSLAIGQGGFFSSDEGGYDQMAWAMAQQWRGMGPVVENLWGHYTTLVAALYVFTGHSMLAAKVMDAALGAGTAILIWYLATLVFPDGKVGKIAGLLTACFPSSILWSSLILRDALTSCVLALILIGAYLLFTRPDVARFLLTTIAWFLLKDIRGWIFVPLGGLLLLGALVFPNLIRRRVATFVVVGLTAMLLPFAIGFGPWGLSAYSVPSPSYLNWKRTAMAEGAQSAFVPPPNAQPPQAAAPTIPLLDHFLDKATIAILLYIPVGLVYVIGTPFPWMLYNWMTRAIAPEMLVWYVLVLLAVYGSIVSRMRWREWFLPAALIVMLTLVLAAIEGNVGTMARHRVMLVAPFVFIFSAEGIIHLWEWRRLTAKSASSA